MILSDISDDVIKQAIESSDSSTVVLNKLLRAKKVNGDIPNYFYMDLHGRPVPIEYAFDEYGDVYIGDSETSRYTQVIISDLDHLHELNRLIDRVHHLLGITDTGLTSVKLIKDTLRLKHPEVFKQIEDITVDPVESKFTVVIKPDISLTHWVHPGSVFNAQALKVILDWIKDSGGPTSP